MPGVGPCRRAHQSFARPEGLAYARLGLAKGQPPDRTKGGATATESGRDSALTRARSTVKCARNRGQVKSDSAVKCVGFRTHYHASRYGLWRIHLGEVVGGGFFIAGCDAPKLSKFVEITLDRVVHAIESPAEGVGRGGGTAVVDDRHGILGFDRRSDPFHVVGLVAEHEVFRRKINVPQRPGEGAFLVLLWAQGEAEQQAASFDHGLDLRRQSASGTTHATTRPPVSARSVLIDADAGAVDHLNCRREHVRRPRSADHRCPSRTSGFSRWCRARSVPAGLASRRRSAAPS